jgi:hypothetical protein
VTSPAENRVNAEKKSEYRMFQIQNIRSEEVACRPFPEFTFGLGHSHGTRTKLEKIRMPSL